MTRRAAALAVVAGAAAWGTTGTSQAVADLDVSPVVVGAVRQVGGAVVLGLLALLVLRRAGRGTPPVPSAPVGGFRRDRRALLVAGAAVVAYQLSFFAGVARAGVALGTVVGIGSVPVFAGVLTWTVDGVRPRRRWWPATAVAIVGVALVLAPTAGAAPVDVVGVVLAASAGFAYAVLTVASRRLLDAGHHPTVVMARVFVVGAVPAVVVLAVADLRGLVGARGAMLTVWLAVVTVAIGYVLYARGLQVLRPPTVGTLTLAEPLVAAALGVALLGERPGSSAAVGAVLLAGGLALAVGGDDHPQEDAVVTTG